MSERGGLPASRNQTIRELWLRVKARHHAHDYMDVYDKPLPDVGCAACPYPHTWPCPDYVDAVAALATLDACGQYPLPAIHAEGYVQHARGHYAYRLVPDPGVGAEHA